MKLVLGCDSAGKPLMDVIDAWLQQQKVHTVTNLSVPPVLSKKAEVEERYAEMSDRVTQGILSALYDRGILICGTGIGVCISANKVPGIRAALTHDTYSAAKAATSNNAQVITMGARVVGPELAIAIVNAWLLAEFDPASHSADNVDAIDNLDRKYSGLT